MPLQPGTKLGPYEIISPIGAGGMGEVYSSKDTRLDRTVAIKVLPSHLSIDPALRQRFEREARTISSLSHPHICALYDIGQQNGISYLVMEFLEGETLAARLNKGPIPLPQVLKYGIEISDALDKAHKKGIVHRDLKPGNIMITKAGIKLLDFGLAKFQSSAADEIVSGVSGLATERKELTAKGTILGTLQYMAPEQLEAKDVDARTDIFALGMVLYEMITGKRAFHGSSQASLIAAILEKDPAPITSIQPMTPPALDRAVRICLAKDPDDRWQNAHDLMSELKWVQEGSSQAGVAAPIATHRKIRELVAWTLAGLATIAAIFFGIQFAKGKKLPPAENEKTLHLQIKLPKDQLLYNTAHQVISLSPDGKKLAIAVQEGADSKILVQSLTGGASEEIPGTLGGATPFFSPDGKWLGFWSNQKLQKVSLSGGTPIFLAPATQMRGAVWARNGNIYFSTEYGGISEVSQNGGQVKKISKILSEQGEQQHRWPEILPGEKTILYTVGIGRMWDDAKIVAQNINTGERKLIVDGGTYSRYIPGGYLSYTRGDSLYAVRFDAASLTVTGSPVEVAKNVKQGISGYSFSSFSNEGMLISASPQAVTLDEMLTWLDKTGKVEKIPVKNDYYILPAISPDGTQVVLNVGDSIFTLDVSRNILLGLTSGGRAEFPIWTADNKRIVYASEKEKYFQLYSKAADNSGEEKLLWAAESPEYPCQVSHDGKRLLYERTYTTGEVQLRVADLNSSGKNSTLLCKTNNDILDAHFSPDDRWIAYSSAETGRLEVYVRPSNGEDRKWQISTEGGFNAIWSPIEKEIYYLSGSKIMAVPFQASETFSPDVPRVLFNNHLVAEMDITPKGDRFFLIEDPKFGKDVTLDVTTNWFEEIRNKMTEASR